MISLAQYLLWLKSVRCTHYLWFRWSISFLKPQQRHGKFVTGKPVVGAGRAVTVTPLRTHGSCPSLQPCFGKSLSARGEFGLLWNSGKRPLRLRLHIPHLPFLSAPPTPPPEDGKHPLHHCGPPARSPKPYLPIRQIHPHPEMPSALSNEPQTFCQLQSSPVLGQHVRPPVATRTWWANVWVTASRGWGGWAARMEKWRNPLQPVWCANLASGLLFFHLWKWTAYFRQPSINTCLQILITLSLFVHYLTKPDHLGTVCSSIKWKSTIICIKMWDIFFRV